MDNPPAPALEKAAEEHSVEPSQTPSSASSISIAENPFSNNHKPSSSPPTPEFTVSTRLVLAFAALAVLTLMVALDGTSLSVALPIMARKLHGTAIEAFWAGTSFLLAATVLQPNFASFSHIFGRMPVIMVSVALFFIGVMMAGFANGFGLLLAGRSVQGVGGGGESTRWTLLPPFLFPSPLDAIPLYVFSDTF